MSTGDIITMPGTQSDERALSRLMPRTVKELAFFGNEAAKSGLFKTFDPETRRPRNLTGSEAFLLMSQGVELGLSPLQSLRELNLIDGRVDVPASVRAAKIAASPKVTQWDVNATPTECTITAKRSDRTTHCSVRVRKEDMNAADVRRHESHMEDWLYARAVRKISRRYFPDFALGLDTSAEYDPERIIDVGRVEEHLGVADQTAPHGYHEGCGGAWELATNTRTGGAFLRCPRCNATAPPPQAVRDAIRGVPPALTIAASVTPEHEPEHVVEASPPATAVEVREDDTVAVQAAIDSALPPEETPPPSDDDAPVVQSDAEPGGGASETETPSLPETEAAPPEGVASTPTDAPEAVAELAMIQWRARARSAIAKYAGEHRTAETGRAQVVEALASQGWDLIKPLAAFLRDASDEAIATLIGAFKIDVAP